MRLLRVALVWVALFFVSIALLFVVFLILGLFSKKKIGGGGISGE